MGGQAVAILLPSFDTGLQLQLNSHYPDLLLKSQNMSKPPVSRRKFIKSATAAVAAGSLVAGQAVLTSDVAAQDRGSQKNNSRDDDRNKGQKNEHGVSGISRAIRAAAIRKDAALRHLANTKNLIPQLTNGDEQRYRKQNYYASFSKTLPHNNLGEVDPSAYRALLKAVDSGDEAHFAAIPLDPSARIPLANPQGAYRYIYAGLDGHATRIRPAPSFRSAEMAAEMGELYWLAFTRDVPFATYQSDSQIAAAIADLNNFSQTVGPTNNNGEVDASVIFRGSSPGDAVGPYISQFLWKDVPYGPSTIVQKYASPTSGIDFMTTNDEWLHIQRGGLPSALQPPSGNSSYIFNNRTLGQYVHGDVLFQAYFNAMLISLRYGSNAIAVGNPYGVAITNQGPFTSLGGPWFIDLLTQAGNLALNGAWYQKWVAHRRLRPEVYAGRVHNHVNNRAAYELHADILNSAALLESYTRFGGYFLPMAYPEGSPTHPAFPAGHATVAGACTTVLKAVFDENFVIPDPVISTNGSSLQPYSGALLTLGGEFNKLASNISLGRDAAGVHYRSDGIEGLFVGEQQAIALLQDYSAALNEDFGGFHFTKFDGTPVSIYDGSVR
jgi:membrane-associated phospholipid phosphatase